MKLRNEEISQVLWVLAGIALVMSILTLSYALQCTNAPCNRNTKTGNCSSCFVPFIFSVCAFVLITGKAIACDVRRKDDNTALSSTLEIPNQISISPTTLGPSAPTIMTIEGFGGRREIENNGSARTPVNNRPLTATTNDDSPPCYDEVVVVDIDVPPPSYKDIANQRQLELNPTHLRYLMDRYIFLGGNPRASSGVTV